MWEAGRTGQPMHVESQRKLTKAAVDKMSLAYDQLKGVRHAFQASERAYRRALDYLAEVRAEAAEEVAEGLEPRCIFEPMVTEGRLTLSDEAEFSLGNITAADMPLRLVFLDKSGSMGCDKNTLSALSLGTRHALSPELGSCLLVLLAGPGETQIYFSRAGDSPRTIDVPLGCCTWFNEPVFLVLKALAPFVEALDTSTLEPQQLPPLQVVCVTDGMDNQSRPGVQTLPELADAVGAIQGSVSGSQLYLPLGSWRHNDRNRASEAIDAGMIPIWLMWVALGGGSATLMDREALAPGRVAIVDACFDAALAGTPATVPMDGGQSAETNVSVGATVTAHAHHHNQAVVLTVHNNIKVAPLVSDEPEPEPEPLMTLDLLFLDGTTARHVDAASVTVHPQNEALADVGSGPQQQIERSPASALALVDTAMGDPGRLMAKVNSEGIVPFDTASEVAAHGLAQRLAAAGGALRVQPIKYDVPPSQFIAQLMRVVGAACAMARLSDGAEIQAAHFLLLSGLKALLREETVVPTELIATAKLGLALGNGSEGVDRMHRILQPLQALLRFLSQTKPKVICTVKGSAARH